MYLMKKEPVKETLVLCDVMFSKETLVLCDVMLSKETLVLCDIMLCYVMLCDVM